MAWLPVFAQDTIAVLRNPVLQSLARECMLQSHASGPGPGRMLSLCVVHATISCFQLAKTSTLDIFTASTAGDGGGNECVIGHCARFSASPLLPSSGIYSERSS